MNEIMLVGETPVSGDWLALLKQQAARYTNGDSGSLPIDTAEELLKSAKFCAEAGDASLPLEKRLRSGQIALQKRTLEGRRMLELARETRLPLNNIAYNDTLRALGDFFLWYDIRFFAHAIPCDIDYPLAAPVPEALLGIDYIHEYLRRLIIENRFCGYFDTETLQRLMRRSAPDFTKTLVNIFTDICVNALGLMLLGEEINVLLMPENARAELERMFHSWPPEEAGKILDKAASRLCVTMGLYDTATRQYARGCVRNLLPRLLHAQSFERIFF